jgi:thioredoxin:protein disulfide reductase
MKRHDNMNQIKYKKLKLVIAFGLIIFAWAFSSIAVAASSVADIVTKKPAAVSAPQTAAQPLDATMAFVPKLRVIDAGTVEVKYTVAPAHYLYRDRFRADLVERWSHRNQGNPKVQSASAAKAMNTTTSPITLPALPAGRLTDDATFGRVEVFDTDIAFRMSTGDPAKAGVKNKAPLRAGAQIRVTSQGCAVAGVCFPAHRHTFTITDVPGKNDAPSEWLAADVGDTSLGFGRKQ